MATEHSLLLLLCQQQNVRRKKNATHFLGTTHSVYTDSFIRYLGTLKIPAGIESAGENVRVS